MRTEIFCDRPRRSRGLGKFGQTEIEDLGQAAPGDEHVGRLDVAMNDAFGVGYVQSVGNLNAEIENALERQRLAANVVAQGFAVENSMAIKGW